MHKVALQKGYTQDSITILRNPKGVKHNRKVEQEVEMKRRCTECKRILSIEEFYKRDDRPGVYNWCKGCMDNLGRFKDFPREKDRGGGSVERKY